MMKKSIYMCFVTLVVLFVFASCGSTSKLESFPKMYEEKPTVMLVMPPINNCSNVEAKDYFYTTMNTPLAELGYYVLPPAATYATLQRESAYDAERFIDGDLKKFGELFGADVAIFTIIKDWKKMYILTKGYIVVDIEYIFKSTKTNEILYRRNASISCDTSVSAGNSLIGLAISAVATALKTALTDYVSVAIACNNASLSDLPVGKYHSEYGNDGEDKAMALNVRLNTHM